MKAIILLSGGLDSTLAAEIMNRNGLELVAVNYKTPFCLCDSHSKGGGCASNARRVTDALGIELRMINATDDFLQVLRDPKHGYGANMNPCIDCRILFFKKSKTIMAEVGASFVITGEVLGQRPMSQHKRQLAIIEKESGLEGLVVRPLSAKLLPPTIPERNGWIKRDSLLSIEGRSRNVSQGPGKILHGGAAVVKAVIGQKILVVGRPVRTGDEQPVTTRVARVGRGLRRVENPVLDNAQHAPGLVEAVDFAVESAHQYAAVVGNRRRATDG